MAKVRVWLGQCGPTSLRWRCHQKSFQFSHVLPLWKGLARDLKSYATAAERHIGKGKSLCI